MSCMLDVACVLEFFVHGFDNHPLPQYDLVIEVHQGILHVLLDLCDEMDVIHEKRLKKTLADIPPVGEELSKEFVRKLLVFKWIPVINISWRKHPLYDFCLVIDDQVQLESVEPAHCALALCCQSPHCLVHVHALDVTAHQRCGVDDGYARTPAQSAGVEEQKQMKCHLCLTLHKAVV